MTDTVKLTERIEIDLSEGFDEETLSQIREGVIGIRSNGNKFLIDYFQSRGVGILVERYGKKGRCWSEFEVHKSDRAGYKIVETESYPKIDAPEDDKYILKLKEAGI